MRKLTSSIYTFEKLIENNFLYVDKTEYIWRLIDSAPAMYFMSRPRRFGKSLTVSTLEAVFSGKKELFKGLAIYDKPYDWKKYPVIHLDMNGWDFRTPEILEESLRGAVSEVAQKHGIVLDVQTSDGMFRELITKMSKEKPVVILLDEYDKPILNNIGKPYAPEILERLKVFYSVIKAFEHHCRQRKPDAPPRISGSRPEENFPKPAEYRTCGPPYPDE